MTPQEAFSLDEMMRLYRQAYISDASHARHDQQSCKPPAMDKEAEQRESAERRLEDADK